MAKKKYLDTKEGSLEQSILGVWEEAAKKMSEGKMPQAALDALKKSGKDVTKKDKKEALSAKQKKLDVDGDGEIEGSDLAKLRKKGAKKEAAEDYKSWLEAVLEVRGLKKKVEEEDDDQPKKSKTETGKQPDKVEINPDVDEHKKKKK